MVETAMMLLRPIPGGELRAQLENAGAVYDRHGLNDSSPSR
jgi:hypothetical protein